MYIDVRKFKYSDPNAASTIDAVCRDKKQTALSYLKWVDENIEDIVERIYEIDDIGVVEQTGQFIKLLKESEFTYSLGIYKSSIALIGVCAEDLCKFFSKLSGHDLDSLSQYDRINKLENLGFLSTSNAASFHVVRKIRNDCLHFNQNFSSKSDADLKVDALLTVNTLKEIYANIIGATDYGRIDPSKLIYIIDAIAKEASAGSHHGVKNIEDLKIRLRNVFAKVTGLDISTNSGHKYEVAASKYKIIDVDLEYSQPEITLQDTRPMAANIVVVDVLSEQLGSLKALKLKNGQLIYAALKSKADGLGMTCEWNFISQPELIDTTSNN